MTPKLMESPDNPNKRGQRVTTITMIDPLENMNPHNIGPFVNPSSCRWSHVPGSPSLVKLWLQTLATFSQCFRGKLAGVPSCSNWETKEEESLLPLCIRMSRQLFTLSRHRREVDRNAIYRSSGFSGKSDI
ncbi:hypothetical protein PAMA_006640 [Pampus argenteus]